MISNFKYRQYLINNNEEYLKKNSFYCLNEKEIHLKNNNVYINFSDLKKDYFNYLKKMLINPISIIFEKQ